MHKIFKNSILNYSFASILCNCCKITLGCIPMRCVDGMPTSEITPSLFGTSTHPPWSPNSHSHGQSDLPFLRFFIFKVKAMSVFKGKGHIVGLVSKWSTSFLFHIFVSQLISAECDGSDEQLNAHNNVMMHLLPHCVSCCLGKQIPAFA